MITIHKLNGVEINEPNNYEALELELNFDENGNGETVSINEWEFGVGDNRNSNDGAKITNTHISNGLLSGVGVGEGLPYKLILDNQKGTKLTLFNGYVDLWRADIQCDLVVAPAVELLDASTLENRIDSFSFKYLQSIGAITSADYVPIPYCINKKQNGVDIIIATVTIFVIVDKLKEAITDIQEYIGNMSANPFTFTMIIGLVFRILYISTLIVSLIKLLLDLYNALVQPVKYHYGMYENVLMRKGLAHLGYALSSSILDNAPFNKCVIMPEKYNTKENNTGKFKRVTGFFSPNQNEQEGFYKGTFGELFRALTRKYDAKIIIKNGTVYFEKQDFNLQAPTYQFPPFERGAKTLNVDDFVSNKIISFATDMQDRNTIQEYLGTSAEITTTPIRTTNINMVLLNKYDPININFALAKRKTSLTFVEEILNVFFKGAGLIMDGLIKVLNAIIKVINAVIKAINKFIKALKIIGIKIKFQAPTIPTIAATNFGNMIENRIGMMVLESDYTSSAKMLMVDKHSNPRNNKLLSNNESILNARYLYENYHYYRSFVNRAGFKPNQYEVQGFSNLPFCFDDFVKVRENSAITDSDGNKGELISLKFNPSKQTATGSYKIKRVYSNNFKETLTEPDGR